VESHSIDLDRLPIEEVRPGVTRQSFSTGRMTFIRYRYRPGTVFPVHSHPQEQMTLVVEGEIEFTFEDRTERLAEGQALVLPLGLPHGARVVGAAPVVTDNYFVPSRTEEIHVLS